eukprot:7476215-Alexandrium_andersonii.AAC.1
MSNSATAGSSSLPPASTAGCARRDPGPALSFLPPIHPQLLQHHAIGGWGSTQVPIKTVKGCNG